MQTNGKLRALVVDDSAFMRNAVRDLLESDPRIEVSGMAVNGLQALEQIKKLEPDVITLDMDMPVMDGLAAIRHIMIETPLPIVALSSLINNGSVTFEALRLGVVDFVPKQVNMDVYGHRKVRQQIIDRLKIASSVNLENLRRVRLPNIEDEAEIYSGRNNVEYLIAVGTNLAGPNTLIRLLSKLRPGLPAAMVVCQEISTRIIESFTREFNRHVAWKVEAGRDGQVVKQGVCYLCSNENSVQLEENEDGDVCLHIGPRQDNPLDMLFSSTVAAFRQNSIGVMLNGLGKDGSKGFAEINAASGLTIAQRMECCVYPNLIRNAIDIGVVDMLLPENELAGGIEYVIV